MMKISWKRLLYSVEWVWVLLLWISVSKIIFKKSTGIHNTHMYEKAIVAMAKQSVTLEVLSYHASASMDDAVRLKVSANRKKFVSGV